VSVLAPALGYWCLKLSCIRGWSPLVVALNATKILHMLGRECPEAVLPDRALYLATFSHLLIANKLLSLSTFISRHLTEAEEERKLPSSCAGGVPCMPARAVRETGGEGVGGRRERGGGEERERRCRLLLSGNGTSSAKRLHGPSNLVL